MARSDPQVNIRMPQALKDRLEEATAETKQSLNREIIGRLESSFSKSMEGDQGLTEVVKQLSASLADEQRRRHREMNALLDTLVETTEKFKETVERILQSGIDEDKLDKIGLFDVLNDVEMRQSHVTRLSIYIGLDDDIVGKL